MLYFPDLKTKVYSLVGQNISLNTQFIENTQLLAWLNEGMRLACLLGKVMKIEVSGPTYCINVVSGKSSYKLPTSYLHPDSYKGVSSTYGYNPECALTKFRVIDVIDVRYRVTKSSSPYTIEYDESLVKVDATNYGKLFYHPSTVINPIYYWLWGDYIYFYPTPVFSDKTITVTMLLTAMPQYNISISDSPTLTSQATTPTECTGFEGPYMIPDEYHDCIAIYAAYRCKQVYRLYDEAEALLGMFAQGLGVSLAEVKGATKNE